MHGDLWPLGHCDPPIFESNLLSLCQIKNRLLVISTPFPHHFHLRISGKYADKCAKELLFNFVGQNEDLKSEEMTI